MYYYLFFWIFLLTFHVSVFIFLKLIHNISIEYYSPTGYITFRYYFICKHLLKILTLFPCEVIVWSPYRNYVFVAFYCTYLKSIFIYIFFSFCIFYSNLHSSIHKNVTTLKVHLQFSYSINKRFKNINDWLPIASPASHVNECFPWLLHRYLNLISIVHFPYVSYARQARAHMGPSKIISLVLWKVQGKSFRHILGVR